MQKKKAALNISVEAIIIIILAITILGLFLGFIRGMFGQVTETFEEMISNEPEPAPATSSQPITLSRETVVAGAGEEVALKIGFYHTGAATGGCSIIANNPEITDTNEDNVCGLIGCSWEASPPRCYLDTGDAIVCTSVDESTYIPNEYKPILCRRIGCAWNTNDECVGSGLPEGSIAASPDIMCNSEPAVIDALYPKQKSIKELAIREKAILTLVFRIGEIDKGTKLCSVDVNGIEKDIMIRIN